MYSNRIIAEIKWCLLFKWTSSAVFAFPCYTKWKLILDSGDKFGIKNIPGTSLDRLKEIVVLVSAQPPQPGNFKAQS